MAGLEAGQLLVGERNQAPVRTLVGLGPVGVGNVGTAVVTGPAEGDPAAVVGVHLTEGQLPRTGGRAEPDRDIGQAESQRASPHTLHGWVVPTRFSWQKTG